MFLKTLEVRNFKSFDSLNVRFDDLNILIGANASGKSNFIRIFSFLRNITQYNLQDAIAMEGGVEYVRNVNIGRHENMSFKIIYDPDSQYIRQTNGTPINIRIPEAAYEFEIGFHEHDNIFHIVKDKLTVLYEFVQMKEENDAQLKAKPDTGKVVYQFTPQTIEATFDVPRYIPFEDKEMHSMLYSATNIELAFPEQSLFLNTPFFNLAHNWFSGTPFANVAIYDFDAKRSQKAASVMSKTELAEDGSNLSLVLKSILDDADKKRMFVNLINYLLPFVDDFKVMKQTDESFLFALRENYCPAAYLPAFLLSDGTINLTAFIVALYFTDNPLLIFEEPEKMVHPVVIGKMVDLLHETAVQRQIIMTTHNPEIVRHAPLQSLMLIDRDKQGFSQILRPAESEHVQIFMQNEIGVADLYVQDLLGM